MGRNGQVTISRARRDLYPSINDALDAGRLDEARELFAQQAQTHRASGQLRAAAMCYELAGSAAQAQGAWIAAALIAAGNDPAEARALLNEAEAVTRQGGLEAWLAARPAEGRRPISANLLALSRRPTQRDWPFVRH
jgi:hypothetical protein